MNSKGFTPKKVLAKTLSGSPFVGTGSSSARIPDLPALTNGTPHAAGTLTPLNLGVRLAGAVGVVTPRKRKLAQAEEGSPSISRICPRSSDRVFAGASGPLDARTKLWCG